MYKIKKKFSICCSHNLWNDKASDENNSEMYGRCISPHGHNYSVTVTLSKQDLDEWGMITNFNIVKDIFNVEIDNRFDHSCLNEDEAFDGIPTTAENMAKVFYDILKKPFKEFTHSDLESIEIEETDGASAIYSE